MAKLLNTTFLVTQSAPATPSSGFGTLFASSSKLFFKNSSGTIYDLTTGGSGGGYINILTYTGSGTYTYNTGSGVQYIKVVCAGGGGGGGSGRINPIGTRAGGGGGAGGNINIAYFSSQSLIGNTYTVRIGAGGNGAARTSAGSLTNGSSGGAGISSSFSTGSTVLLWGGGGTAGAGGGLTNAGANTAPTTSSTPNPYPPFYYSGVNGAVSSTTAVPTPAGNALSGTRTLAGGGAGGALVGTTYSGGSGSAIYNYNILVTSGSPSLSSSGLPGDNGAPVIDVAHLLFYSGSNITTGVKIGTGGHGGGGGGFTFVGPSGGNGGSGSLGAGGGGGGAAVTSSVGYPIQNGGGGRGGDGFVLIFEYY
jgi:hypothetical protein